MERYTRHKNLFAEGKMEQIQKARVMVVGAGGLGCTVLQLIARLGVDTLHVYDCADVDLPDLNRQLLYDEGDISLHKADCATQKLRCINSSINVIGHTERVDESTLLPEVDLVFDCLDNFQTRFILDRLLYPLNIPMIHGGVNKFFAQVTSIVPGQSKMLAELFPVDTASIDKQTTKDIFPPVVTITASIQVSEGVKYLTGQHSDMLINRVLMIDALANSFEIIDFN